MPRLYKYRNRNAHYVLTAIGGSVITYQLTSEGERKLSAARICSGELFPRALLLDLYRSGDAFTRGSGVEEQSGLGQLEMDFKNDPDPETAFPACDGCGSVDDLHLVIGIGEGATAKLNCAECRVKAAADTSVPVPLLSFQLIVKLFGLKCVSAKEKNVARLQELFQAEFESKWEKLRKSGGPRQGDLLTGSSGSELNFRM